VLKKRPILWVHWRSNFKNKHRLSRENQSWSSCKSGQTTTTIITCILITTIITCIISMLHLETNVAWEQHTFLYPFLFPGKLHRVDFNRSISYIMRASVLAWWASHFENIPIMWYSPSNFLWSWEQALNVAQQQQTVINSMLLLGNSGPQRVLRY
jgi:hypothetical protein